MKLSAWHKAQGDKVEWYNAFDNYDIVYMTKVFNFTPDYGYVITNADKVVRGGTGYDIDRKLPRDAEYVKPDYSIYPQIDSKTAFGFLTRGCPNKCAWCIVPLKEGRVRPYMDVEDIAVDGRTRLILMDNNILALPEYAKEQLGKIIKNGYRVDFNQALDARLVTDEFADLLAKVKWIDYIRFGCDSKAQVKFCKEAIRKLRERGYNKWVMLYTIIDGDIVDCIERIERWRHEDRVCVNAAPYRDPRKLNTPPQWQKDMARWANRKEFYRTIDFVDFSPRKGFVCREYLSHDELIRLGSMNAC